MIRGKEDRRTAEPKPPHGRRRAVLEISQNRATQDRAGRRWRLDDVSTWFRFARRRCIAAQIGSLT